IWQTYAAVFGNNRQFIECGNTAGVDGADRRTVDNATSFPALSLDPAQNDPVARFDLANVLAGGEDKTSAFMTKQMWQIGVLATHTLHLHELAAAKAGIDQPDKNLSGLQRGRLDTSHDFERGAGVDENGAAKTHAFHGIPKMEKTPHSIKLFTAIGSPKNSRVGMLDYEGSRRQRTLTHSRWRPL